MGKCPIISSQQPENNGAPTSTATGAHRKISCCSLKGKEGTYLEQNKKKQEKSKKAKTPDAKKCKKTKRQKMHQTQTPEMQETQTPREGTNTYQMTEPPLTNGGSRTSRSSPTAPPPRLLRTRASYDARLVRPPAVAHTPVHWRACNAQRTKGRASRRPNIYLRQGLFFFADTHGGGH